MEKNKIKKIGEMTGGVWDKRYNCTKGVYSINGLCPTLTTFGGGGTEVKIFDDRKIVSTSRNTDKL